MTKQRIGYIGVGLMGHGAAKNILQKGYSLTIMGHRNRAPVDDLIALGAREAKTPADVARASDVVFLCLPSTVEVEQTIYGESGVLEGASKGLIVVDSTTADPRSTQRIGVDLAKKGVRMADAPMGRTPKEAEAGKLSTFIGGDASTVRELKPII
ncbi:MAG TPA: NAD(P)-dependent oxidoreductase, partial [Casimicrobiaceae bacterium]|nr:NAD(P)-dependent oxidoreductase [Casimicrobiaceae bacterium]